MARTISQLRATEAGLGKLGARDISEVLTLVIEETLDPGSWLIITGWTATERERKILERKG